MRAAVLPLDPASYERHALHREERVWPETNCWVDLWIELLHALGQDPVAAMGFALALDFEGDQWRFFKFAPADLGALYGVDLQELAIWRPVEWHVREQVAAGRPVIVEVDAFHLPDTAGTSYGADHVKTSIAVQMIDPESRRLGYFHNAGYFELAGDDYAGVFAAVGAGLPPYVEFVRLDGLRRLEPHELVARAVALGRAHFERRPADNPVRRFRTRFAADLEWLRAEPMSTFHLYAFATLRQCGAGAEVAATFLRWLGCHGHRGLEPAAAAYQRVSESAKGVQFTLARAVAGRSVEFSPMFDAMERDWDQATAVLAARHGD